MAFDGGSSILAPPSARDPRPLRGAAMTALVVYDSLYGNTERIAHAIAAALGAEAKHVGAVAPADLTSCDLLVVGTPTHGGRPSPATKKFLKTLPDGILAGTSVATFDTRFAAANSNVVARLFIGLLGYAAPRLARDLSHLGGRIEGEPGGFLVGGKEGPLLDGEEARAASWASGLQAATRSPG